MSQYFPSDVSFKSFMLHLNFTFAIFFTTVYSLFKKASHAGLEDYYFNSFCLLQIQLSPFFFKICLHWSYWSYLIAFNGFCSPFISLSSSENIFLLQPLAQDFLIYKKRDGDEASFLSGG